MAAPPAQIQYHAFVTFKDHAGRLSSPRIQISSGDYTAYLTDTTTGNVHDWMVRMEALSCDNITDQGVTQTGHDPNVVGVPTTEEAVNSAKLVVLGRDVVTGKPARTEIPGRLHGAFSSVKGDVILTGAGATSQVTNFVTAIEATWLSEDGNAVTVIEIKVAGRGTAP